MELGVRPVRDGPLQESLQDCIAGVLCGGDGSRSRQRAFMMPFTMGVRHLRQVCAEPYLLLEKTDGVRYFLLLPPGRQGAFLVDRKFTCYPLPEGFPQDTAGALSLMDGELVLNRHTGLYSFLLFDAMVCCGEEVWRQDFPARMQAAQRFVERVCDPVDSPLPVLVKDTFPAREVARLFDRISVASREELDMKPDPRYRQGDLGEEREQEQDDMAELLGGGEIHGAGEEYIYKFEERGMCHVTDGIIFTPVKVPYSPGTCDRLFKWKYPHMNSVDFQLDLLGRESEGLEVSVPFEGPPDAIVNLKKPALWGEERADRELRREDEVQAHSDLVRCRLLFQTTGQVVPYRDVQLPSRLQALFAQQRMRFHGKIAECAFDRRAGEWSLLRMRWDKDVPNFCLTIADALEAGAQNLGRDKLIRSMERELNHHHHHHHRPPPPPNGASSSSSSAAAPGPIHNPLLGKRPNEGAELGAKRPHH